MRVIAIAIGCWLSACVLSAAPIFAAEKLRISYAVKKLKPDELFTLGYLKQLDQSGYIDQLYQRQ